MRIRRLASSLVCVFAMAVSTTVGFASTSVSAATVGTGVCTATVGSATGVTMTVVSGECVLRFANVGTTTWTVPSGITTVRVLVVGAGGGGSTDLGGGGGGGQVVDSSTTAVSGEVTISVGARGTAGSGRVGDLTSGGRTGSSSSFVSSGGTVNAKGGSGATGRAGADNKNADGTANNTGYTGGGGAFAGTGGSTGTGGALYKGGDGGGAQGGGGGGGAGGAGQPRSGTANGGVGLSSDITGTAIFYGGGGGGSTYVSTVGAGGNGGGGGGGSSSRGFSLNGVSGENGLGGGGGGGGTGGGGGSGGSGVVVVRYSLPVIPSNTGAPVISGTAATGSTLTTSNGTWRGPPTSYTYQWQRATATGGYENIATATSNSYVVSELDIGYFIKVSVTGTNGLGSVSATSAPTTAVVDIAPTNTALPVISGTARTGATLTATNGSWTSSPSLFEYQWKRASDVGGTYNDIASATNRTYELTNADIGKFIKVSVIVTNSIGPSSAALSAATSVVVDLADSVVPTATTPIATATGFTFTISNYSSSYTYALTTTNGSVSRSTDDVTVTGLSAGGSATVTIAVTRANYKPGSKTVTGTAAPATTTTTTTLKPVVVIDIQAPVTTVAQGQTPVTTVAQGQASVATIAPNVSQSLTTATTTTTTTPATAITPRVKNAAIPTESSVATTIAPRVKNAAIPTASPIAPMIPQVSTGESALDVGGVRTKIAVSRENNQIVLKSGTYQAVLSGLDSSGATRSLDVDGNLRLTSGDALRLNMGGFKVGTQVDVWMFSTPVRLGTAKVEADGRVAGTFTIPKNIEDGSHRIAVTAKLPNGKPTTFTLGILVGNFSTTSTLTRVLIAIPITLAIGFGFLLPNQIRRRRKIRTA